MRGARRKEAARSGRKGARGEGAKRKRKRRSKGRMRKRSRRKEKAKEKKAEEDGEVWASRKKENNQAILRCAQIASTTSR